MGELITGIIGFLLFVAMLIFANMQPRMDIQIHVNAEPVQAVPATPGR